MTSEELMFIELSTQYELLDSHRQRDMSTIDTLMGMILALYSEDITWDKLHIVDKESQIHQLQLIIKQVKDITLDSNQTSNKARREFNGC